MPRTLIIAPLAFCLLLTACAAGIEPLGSDAQQTHPAWLAGTWQGSGYQVGASNTQREEPITMTFADDGTSKASTASGLRSSTSWLVAGRVVLGGVATDGAKIRIR